MYFKNKRRSAMAKYPSPMEIIENPNILKKFPELSVKDVDGKPCVAASSMAKVLGITEREMLLAISTGESAEARAARKKVRAIGGAMNNEFLRAKADREAEANRYPSIVEIMQNPSILRNYPELEVEYVGNETYMSARAMSKIYGVTEEEIELAIKDLWEEDADGSRGSMKAVKLSSMRGME
jgi:hypothetical protein